jgi:hypothetical protein
VRERDEKKNREKIVSVVRAFHSGCKQIIKREREREIKTEMKKEKERVKVIGIMHCKP